MLLPGVSFPDDISWVGDSQSLWRVPGLNMKVADAAVQQDTEATENVDLSHQLSNSMAFLFDNSSYHSLQNSKLCC